MSATPILDLLQEPPAPRSNKWTIAICLAVGAAIGLAPITLTRSLPGFNLLLWLPAIYVAVTIHELGHLAVGKLVGMAPGGLVVGGFVMMKSRDRWTFRFDRRRILGGGLAVPLPVKGKFSVAPFAWMVAAGPIASILSTVLCWIAFLNYGSGTWDWIGSCFRASAVGLLSLIPMSVGLNKSDGARIRMLMTKPGEAHAWMAAVAVQPENANGVRPRDWDSEIVEQMLATLQPGSEQVFPRLMAFLRCLDEQKESDALEHLENALAASAGSGKAVRQVLFLQAAEVSACLKGNVPNARVWRDRAMKLRKPESVACTDAAIAMCEGRFDDAIRDIAAARTFMERRNLDSGPARFAKELLDDRERRCKEALHAAAGV